MVNHLSFKKILFVSSLSFIGLISNNVMAKDHKDYDFKGERCMKQLNLSKEQREKMKSIYREVKRERSGIQIDVKNIQEQLTALFQNSRFDEGKAKEIIEVAQREDSNEMLMKLKARHAVHQLLTAEQKQTFESCQKKQFKHKKRDWD